jgi:hypothetical protein
VDNQSLTTHHHVATDPNGPKLRVSLSPTGSMKSAQGKAERSEDDALGERPSGPSPNGASQGYCAPLGLVHAQRTWGGALPSLREDKPLPQANLSCPFGAEKQRV